MNVVVFYVGSSLLAPLKMAEQGISRDYNVQLTVSAHNFGASLNNQEWQAVESDLSEADVVFVIHVMDGENAARLIALLDREGDHRRTVVVINCMPELMRRTAMGRLDVAKFFAGSNGTTQATSRNGLNLLAAAGSWIGKQARGKSKRAKSGSHHQYLKLVDRLPGVLRFVPAAGSLRDVKNYLYLFCYFLQPTPANIRSMVLLALKEYAGDERLQRVKVPQPESMPSVAVYHPDAPKLFESFENYQKWYRRRTNLEDARLSPASTIGLLLMRPQVVSKTTRHYDALIRALEAEDLNVIPAISTLMDNRQACSKFFLNPERSGGPQSRVSQIVSLTGFSFVGGPAMNDNVAAAQFLQDLNRPYRSAVSLDMQTIEAWEKSLVGLNPVQAGMQVAIPEIDGATEPFVYGGIPTRGVEPLPLEDRCRRLARRIKRWNRLRTTNRAELKLAFVLFCFPPSKGNIGTAADLDVFPSIWNSLKTLQQEGYTVQLPSSAEELREQLIGGNSEKFGSAANIAYRMSVDEYWSKCEYVEEIEKSWGPAPGRVNTFGTDILIQGLQLGNIFLGVQPTFGYEGDPMRLLMSKGSTPHHGFMGFYTYLSKVLDVDAVVHVGTHGSLEFMPGKQLGLSGECWPDRLIGELPNIYLYSVNNPSEGSIAKRRSYAELISYLTPPIESAGLYKDFSALKELVSSYRASADDDERERLFESIESLSQKLNLSSSAQNPTLNA